MRGYVRVAVMGVDTTKKNIKKGRGLNITFNRNGTYAALITKTGSNITQKKIVPLEKVPGSYRRHEFIDMYPPDQASSMVNVNFNNQQQAPVNFNNQQQVPNAVPQARPRAFCSQCGAELPDGATFCPSCGSSRN